MCDLCWPTILPSVSAVQGTTTACIPTVQRCTYNTFSCAAAAAVVIRMLPATAAASQDSMLCRLWQWCHIAGQLLGCCHLCGVCLHFAGIQWPSSLTGS